MCIDILVENKFLTCSNTLQLRVHFSGAVPGFFYRWGGPGFFFWGGGGGVLLLPWRSKITEIQPISTFKQMLAISICFNKRYRSYIDPFFWCCFFKCLQYLSFFFIYSKVGSAIPEGSDPPPPPLEPPMLFNFFTIKTQKGASAARDISILIKRK